MVLNNMMIVIRFLFKPGMIVKAQLSQIEFLKEVNGHFQMAGPLLINGT